MVASVKVNPCGAERSSKQVRSEGVRSKRRPQPPFRPGMQEPLLRSSTFASAFARRGASADKQAPVERAGFLLRSLGCYGGQVGGRPSFADPPSLKLPPSPSGLRWRGRASSFAASGCFGGQVGGQAGDRRRARAERRWTIDDKRRQNPLLRGRRGSQKPHISASRRAPPAPG